LTTVLGDHPSALKFLEESLAQYRELGDGVGSSEGGAVIPMPLI
jgi:hypothetical protein